MSWLKQSDVSANHPLNLRVLEVNWVDERLLTEVYGWVNRCATQSAAFDKDYIVEVGTARMLAGLSRYQELLDTALYCGIFEEKEIDENGSKRRVLKLVEDEDLFHMILKSDKERERNRRADTYDMAKKSAIIKRDGAECRWCGRIVNFMFDQKSARKGEIDHLEPKDLDTSEPTPIERLVVACKACNSSRKAGEHWDKELRPVPAQPYYTEDTVAWLKKAGIIGIKVSTQRTELHTPEPAPAPETVQAPATDVATENDIATDTSGLSASTIQEATDTEPGETLPAATATPAPVRREPVIVEMNEDFDYGQINEYLASEAVETPHTGETPAEVTEDATDTSGASVPAQEPIELKSKNNRSIIKKSEGVGSGSAGSGRVGTGLGRDGKRDSVPVSSDPVRPSKPSRRRNRPRRRKK